MRLKIACLVTAAVLPSLAHAQVPVFKITQDDSTINFSVKASVALEGHFDKWSATLTFTSPDVTTGVLDVKIQADSVNTGSGMKDGKLKSKDFFDVKENPYITFKSTKVVVTGPNAADVQGVFTIRGVSKPESLKLTGERNATNTGGTIDGIMAFDRKEYGMTSGIPFIKIADRVEVTVHLIAHRTSGPPVVIK
ncbi:MAG TPA: YceI family protein [Bryobacteraceae bacterium]|jgi:polyisoprenoid-binding protein YceI|nr:YceI family protein [Bryobacteraceae bacterium]